MTVKRTYRFAGIATLGNAPRVVVASNMIKRTKDLTGSGYTNTTFVQLPSPMTRTQAANYLKTAGLSIVADDPRVLAEVERVASRKE